MILWIPGNRILKALKKEIPDCVPTFELLIDEASIIKLAGLLFDRPQDPEGIKTRFGEEATESLELHLKIADRLESGLYYHLFFHRYKDYRRKYCNRQIRDKISSFGTWSAASF